MISVNNRAAAIVHEMMEEHESLGLGVTRLKNGTMLIDAGIDTPGSLEGGRLFSQACMGALGKVHFIHQHHEVRDDADGTDDRTESFWLPAVTVEVTLPHIACMAAQYAGWAIQEDGFFAIGSGPARALACEEEIYRKLDYHDQADTAVLMLEGRIFPDETVAGRVAEKCGVRPENVMLLIAPTASLVGSIQIAARSVETCLHKLAELGFDVRRVRAACGTCPLAPVAADDTQAIGRTNDALLYGSRVFLTVDAADDELTALIDKVPSCASRDYGTRFQDLFMRYGGDFFRIDRMLFSPARVEINNCRSGRMHVAGRINPFLLQASMFG
jgi:methenyltetrahydromethanopterin cyclohydrolase